MAKIYLRVYILTLHISRLPDGRARDKPPYAFRTNNVILLSYLA